MIRRGCSHIAVSSHFGFASQSASEKLRATVFRSTTPFSRSRHDVAAGVRGQAPRCPAAGFRPRPLLLERRGIRRGALFDA